MRSTSLIRGVLLVRWKCGFSRANRWMISALLSSASECGRGGDPLINVRVGQWLSVADSRRSVTLIGINGADRRHREIRIADVGPKDESLVELAVRQVGVARSAPCNCATSERSAPCNCAPPRSSALQLRVRKVGALQLRILEVGALQLRAARGRRPATARLQRSAPCNCASAEVGALQLRATEVGALQLRVLEVAPCNCALSRLAPCNCAPIEVRALQLRVLR